MKLMTKYGEANTRISNIRHDPEKRRNLFKIRAFFNGGFCIDTEAWFGQYEMPDLCPELVVKAIEAECERRDWKPLGSLMSPCEKIIVPGPVPGGFNPDPEAPFCITPDGIFVVFFDLGNEASRQRAEEIGDGYQKVTKRNVILMSRMPKASRPFHTPPEPRMSGS